MVNRRLLVDHRGRAGRGRHSRDELAVHRRPDRAGAGAAVRRAATGDPRARACRSSGRSSRTSIYYDKRLLDFEPPPEEVIVSDQKRLVVDTYTRYRITDPLLFYQTVGTEAARARPAERDGQRQPAPRAGQRHLVRLCCRTKRSAIMRQIRDEVERSGEAVRHRGRRRAASAAPTCPKRTARRSTPACSPSASSRRAQYRGEGAEAAQTVRANADRERTVILAEAQRDAQRVRGEGDAESIQIYADAFGQDKEFFAFYRSMQAYRDALNGRTTPPSC